MNSKRSRHTLMLFYRNIGIAKRADCVVQFHFALVQFDAVFFLKRCCHLFGCDRSENASAFSGFSCQFNRQAFQLFFQLFSFLALKISFLLFFLLLSVQFADGGLVRFNRQIVFQQEVMCVAIRHVFNLAFFAFAFYVFQKDHFHSFIPPSLFSIMAAFSWPMASSIVAFGICVAALVKWPPPPRFSITIWT